MNVYLFTYSYKILNSYFLTFKVQNKGLLLTKEPGVSCSVGPDVADLIQPL